MYHALHITCGKCCCYFNLWTINHNYIFNFILLKNFIHTSFVCKLVHGCGWWWGHSSSHNVSLVAVLDLIEERLKLSLSQLALDTDAPLSYFPCLKLALHVSATLGWTTMLKFSKLAFKQPIIILNQFFHTYLTSSNLRGSSVPSWNSR